MPKLYEKITHGDRRTVVKKFKAGEELPGPNMSTYVVKADITLKVTEQYNATFRKWYDVIYHVEDAIESDSPGLWVPLEPEPAKKTWFDRLFGWLS